MKSLALCQLPNSAMELYTENESQSSSSDSVNTNDTRRFSRMDDMLKLFNTLPVGSKRFTSCLADLKNDRSRILSCNIQNDTSQSKDTFSSSLHLLHFVRAMSIIRKEGENMTEKNYFRWKLEMDKWVSLENMQRKLMRKFQIPYDVKVEDFLKADRFKILKLRHRILKEFGRKPVVLNNRLEMNRLVHHFESKHKKQMENMENDLLSAELKRWTELEENEKDPSQSKSHSIQVDRSTSSRRAKLGKISEPFPKPPKPFSLKSIDDTLVKRLKEFAGDTSKATLRSYASYKGIPRSDVVLKLIQPLCEETTSLISTTCPTRSRDMTASDQLSKQVDLKSAEQESNGLFTIPLNKKCESKRLRATLNEFSRKSSDVLDIYKLAEKLILPKESPDDRTQNNVTTGLAPTNMQHRCN